MTTHTLEEMLSRGTAATESEQNVEAEDLDHASRVMFAPIIPPERRCEPRLKYRYLCSYEMLEAIDEDSVVIERGEAFVLNRSIEGRLLFMGQAPQVKQLTKYTPPDPSGAGPRMSLRSNGLGQYRWSHSEISIWLDVDGSSAPVTICRSSRISHGHDCA